LGEFITKNIEIVLTKGLGGRRDRGGKVMSQHAEKVSLGFPPPIGRSPPKGLDDEVCCRRT
jgi:hypothetical protein